MVERDRTRPVPLRLSLGLGTGSMLQPLNASMIAVAIVAIGAHFGGLSGTAWVISGLYIATAVVSPAAGRIGVLFGPRRTYLVGLAIIAGASVLGALAPTIGVLVAARVLQGVGTAIQYPTAMTIIRRVIEREGGTARSALAVLSVCAQSMVALGPTLGGVLTGALGWQAIMWVNLPMIAITLVWVLRVTPPDPPADVAVALTERADGRAGRTRAVLRLLDLPGAILMAATITTVMLWLLSLSEQPQWWLAPIAAACAVAFVVREYRAAEPFIDIAAVVANRALSATLLRTTVTYAAFYLVFFGLPLWLQGATGRSAGVAGLLMLPLALVGITATFLATRMYGTVGPRRTLAVGTVGLTVGGLVLATVVDTGSSLAVLVAAVCVLGVPNAFNNIGNQNIVNAVTGTRQVGTALGMYRTVQYLAANIAAVIIETVFTRGVDDGGLHVLGWIIAVLGGLLLLEVTVSPTLRRLRPGR